MKVFVWKWNGYAIRVDEAQITAYYNGTQVLDGGLTLRNPTTRFGMVAMIARVLVASSMTEAESEMLLALYEDMMQNPDKLDWWACPHCGHESFLVPNDEPICVWCGGHRDY